MIAPAVEFALAISNCVPKSVKVYARKPDLELGALTAVCSMLLLLGTSLGAGWSESEMDMDAVGL